MYLAQDTMSICQTFSSLVDQCPYYDFPQDVIQCACIVHRLYYPQHSTVDVYSSHVFHHQLLSRDFIDTLWGPLTVPLPIFRSRELQGIGSSSLPQGLLVQIAHDTLIQIYTTDATRSPIQVLTEISVALLSSVYNVLRLSYSTPTIACFRCLNIASTK